MRVKIVRKKRRLNKNVLETFRPLDEPVRATTPWTHLQDVDVRHAVGAVAAAVHLDVFEPLDVRLSVAVNLAVELHVAAHHHRLVGRQAGLQDGPVRRPL